MKYRLGLDLGSTSLGWAVVELNEYNDARRLVDMGVRIFPDGRDAQSHTPINVERRMARGMRRRSDRIKIRKRRTLALIHKYGLDFDISGDIERLENPYKLRALAVEQKLTADELGRVFFHLAQRRGFKSNRKETRGSAGGKLKNATEALRKATDDKTLGQFQNESGKYRFSDQFDGDVIKDGALYPTREMYLDEFHKICDVQNVSDDMRRDFENVIFYQRRLLPPQIGHCMFEPSELRAYKYTPAFQKWRVLQQLNQLRIENSGSLEALSVEQRDKLMNIMLVSFDGVVREKKGHVKLTFAAIKKQLGLSARTTKFNLESENRKEIDVDTTAFAFAEIGEGDFWNSLSGDAQLDVLEKINDDNLSDDELIRDLMDKYNLAYERAEKIIGLPLEDDVGNVSLLAIGKMLPYLEQGLLYHEAAREVYGAHSEQDIKELDELPYYGDLMVLRSSLVEDKNGVYRTMNATVHIAMNQIRAVVNDLISQYGKPFAITIETGREVHAGAKERAEIESQQVKNKKENDRIAAELQSAGVQVNRENIQKYKLWELLGSSPLDRCCVYTGEVISKEKLFSPQFEIEHIFPFSRTLDDSLANKTISRVDANKFKGNRTPAEAFTAIDSPWCYDEVWARAQKLPPATRWRFNRGAIDLFLKNNDCIARALNDTRHMTRLAVTYLKHVCADKNNVIGMPGRLTAMFRDMWHLDWWKDKAEAEKYRGNHIHHAIDAFVVACAGRGNLQRLSCNSKNPEIYSGKSLKDKRKDWFDGIALPFAGFDYFDFKMKCENTVISYRKSIKRPSSDGTIGCLHEDTAYNLEDFDKNGRAIMSRHESLPVTDAGRKKFAKDFKRLNKTVLQTFICDAGCGNDTPDIAERFLDWARARGIKKVRMLKDGVDISGWVPVFHTRSDRDAFHDTYTAWYVADGISAGIVDKHAKCVQQNKENSLRERYQNAARRAYKWYIGGNNFCSEIFEIRSDDSRYPKLAGKWQMEIVSNYSAQLNAGQPMWRKKYATARRVMSLRINDMVMAEFGRDDSKLPKGLIDTVKRQCMLEQKDTVWVVFRVKKISSDGRVYLRPHFIAKEEADTKSWAASSGSLQEHNARKISVSPTGKILK